MKDILNFDKRAGEYTARVILDPNTHKGDVETCYTIACDEQLSMDRKSYLPCINFLNQAVENLSRMLLENKINVTAVINWQTETQEQLTKLPYMLRSLGDGIFLQTDKEKEK